MSFDRIEIDLKAQGVDTAGAARSEPSLAPVDIRRFTATFKGDPGGTHGALGRVPFDGTQLRGLAREMRRTIL
jgi:hypothetical protein